MLLEFFKNHVVNIKRGAKVLLERIEDYEGLFVEEDDDLDDNIRRGAAAQLSYSIQDQLEGTGISMSTEVESMDNFRMRSGTV